MSHEIDKATQEVVNLLALQALAKDGWDLVRDNKDGGALVLSKGDRQIVGGFHCYVEPVEDEPVEESIIKAENLVSANPNPTEPVGYVLERDDETEWWNGEAWVDTLNDGAKVYDDDGTGHMPKVDAEDARWVQVWAHEVDGCLTTEVCSGKDTCQDCLDVRKSVGEEADESGYGAIAETEGQEISFDLQGFDKVPGDLLGPGPHVTPDENDEHFASPDANHAEPA